MPGNIFISYRRDDAAADARQIYLTLRSVFASDQIYMDVKKIHGGENFTNSIESALQNCAVLVAVIGPEWNDGSRLDNEDDFVRMEIATALRLKKHVIPVLVGNASLPEATELPEDMRGLIVHNMMELRHSSFQRDAKELVDSLRKLGISQTAKKRRFLVGAAGAAVLALVGAGLFFYDATGPELDVVDISFQPATSLNELLWYGYVTERGKVALEELGLAAAFGTDKDKKVFSDYLDIKLNSSGQDAVVLTEILIDYEITDADTTSPDCSTSMPGVFEMFYNVLLGEKLQGMTHQVKVPVSRNIRAGDADRIALFIAQEKFQEASYRMNVRFRYNSDYLTDEIPVDARMRLAFDECLDERVYETWRRKMPIVGSLSPKLDELLE